MDSNASGQRRVQTQWSLDFKLRVLREAVAAAIALLIVVATSVMLYIVFTRYVSSGDAAADKQFERAKDLLLFVNPLLGVVIGYYFNKVSTEARAEKAEEGIAVAHQDVQQALEDRNEAKAEAKEAKSVLNEVIPAAEQVLREGNNRQPGTLSMGEGTSNDTQARRTLQAALDRAKRIG
jgi:hypothetical protein